jgi:hypothetical protein
MKNRGEERQRRKDKAEVVLSDLPLQLHTQGRQHQSWEFSSFVITLRVAGVWPGWFSCFHIVNRFLVGLHN